MTYQARYNAYRNLVEDALRQVTDACAAPEPLQSAMCYSLLGGGKRLRPVLLLAACEMGGGEAAQALPYACALEMIHTYSLIHDDLPAMDDDDMRRGRPTCHKVYGEGMALLAGDGLLSLAFETMLSAAESAGGETSKCHVDAMRRIALAAGTRGMVAGQCVDIICEADGKGGPQEIDYIDLHKTADLFIGAVTAGLALAGADALRMEAGRRYAQAVGVAFQIADDLLDIEGDTALLGKATGMDAARGKLTYPGVHGMEAARAALRESTQTALSALQSFGAGGSFLTETARALLERDR